MFFRLSVVVNGQTNWHTLHITYVLAVKLGSNLFRRAFIFSFESEPPPRPTKHL